MIDTEELYRKLSEMSERITQLEDALASLQSNVSSETHDLLQGDLLSIKHIPEPQSSVEPDSSTNDPLVDTMEAFGTLTIDDQGEARYFGVSAGTEVCFKFGYHKQKFTVLCMAWLRLCFRYIKSAFFDDLVTQSVV